MNESITDLAQRLSRIRRDAVAAAVQPAPVPPAAEEPPAPPAVDGLVSHGDPIDIGWINGSVDARLTLSVRPGMDPIERDKLLADLREAVDIVAPVRPTQAGEGR